MSSVQEEGEGAFDAAGREATDLKRKVHVREQAGAELSS